MTVTCLAAHKAPIISLQSRKKQLVSTGEDLYTFLWDIETMKVDLQFKSEIEIISIQFVPNSDVMYYSSGNSLFLWDLKLEKHELCCTIESEISTIDVHWNGNFIGFVDEDGFVYIYDIRQKYVKKLRSHHNGFGTSFQFRPTLAWQATTGAFDCQIMGWDFSRGSCIANYQITQTGMINPPFVHSLNYSKTGNQLALGLGTGMISLFQVSRKLQFKPVAELEFHGWNVTGLLFHHSLQQREPNELISCGIDKKLGVWDLETYTLKKQIDLNRKANAIAMIENWIAIGGTCSNRNDYHIDFISKTDVTR
jgi:WD40 repeat protein